MTQIPSLARRRQGGVALLEALLAAVLLALGLLGTIGLQARAYSSLSEAGMRAEATIAAERMLGMMMADTANLTTYAYTTTTANPSTRVTNWLTATRRNIPAASATIGVTAATATAPANVVITITWPRKAGGPNNTYAVRAYI